jgi:hypothetical protein
VRKIKKTKKTENLSMAFKLHSFFKQYSTPLALLITSFLSFSLLIPSLGFYWDDFPMIWFGQLLGPTGYLETLSSDRPFLAGIYFITTSLLNSSPLSWQILGIVSRWITAVILWWTLKNLWPKNIQQAAWVAFLFAVYPGFKQQPISVIYSNGFLLLAFYFLSWGLMIKAQRNPRHFWKYTIAAMLSSAICTFSTEYYVGLEAVRLAFLWILTEKQETQKQKIISTIKAYLPYGIVMVAFLIWRVLIFKFPTYQPTLIEDTAKNPPLEILVLLNNILQSVFNSGWFAWISTFRFPNLSDFEARSTLLIWGIIIVCIPTIWFYLYRFLPGKDQLGNQENSWGKQAVVLGIIALVSCGWPFWITNLPVQLHFPYDRFTLAFMVGSCLLIVGLIDWIIRDHWQKTIILALFISMAIGANIENANSYRREWSSLKDFFWQLTWRAPGLKDGTSVFTKYFPLSYYSDNSLTAPLNWTYAPENHSTLIPYLFGFTDVRLGANIDEYQNDVTIRQHYRSALFESTTTQSLVVFYSPPGCLKVLDPDQSRDVSAFPSDVKEAKSISHLSQIIASPENPAVPPAEVFGDEPAHQWCYYYQKAELARQVEDWEKVVELEKEAMDQRYLPQEASEWLVFMEANAHIGDWHRSMQIASLSYSMSKDLQKKICTTIDSLEEQIPHDSEADQYIEKARNKVQCSSK